MKHVWCIDDDKFNLFEGYVMDNYKNYDGPPWAIKLVLQTNDI